MALDIGPDPPIVAQVLHEVNPAERRVPMLVNQKTLAMADGNWTVTAILVPCLQRTMQGCSNVSTFDAHASDLMVRWRCRIKRSLLLGIRVESRACAERRTAALQEYSGTCP